MAASSKRFVFSLAGLGTCIIVACSGGDLETDASDDAMGSTTDGASEASDGSTSAPAIGGTINGEAASMTTAMDSATTGGAAMGPGDTDATGVAAVGNPGNADGSENSPNNSDDPTSDDEAMSDEADAQPSMSMTMAPEMMASGDETTDDGASTDDMMDAEMSSMDDASDSMDMLPDDTGTVLGDDGSVADCPAAPADAPPEAIDALRIVNEARIAAGSGCITMVSELNVAAKNHCDYYAANDGSCTADAHSEVNSCEGFTGSSFGDRAQAAGYSGRPASEVMAFSNDPQRSIYLWINSVWHRTPVLSPWITEMGYGAAEGCDTIDFGLGVPLGDEIVVVYPYAGQVDVPTVFHGDREGPEPPMPDTGWPSGMPINVYAQGVEITEHLLTIDGDDTPIEHMWLIPEEHSLLRNEVFLYANLPLEAMTTYRVRLNGSYVGGALNLDWTFTTGEAEMRGFGGF